MHELYMTLMREDCYITRVYKYAKGDDRSCLNKVHKFFFGLKTTRHNSADNSADNSAEVSMTFVSMNLERTLNSNKVMALTSTGHVWK